jgi:hypothetical protein
VGPLAISDVRRDLSAFLEDYFRGCRRFRWSVRPFSNRRSVSGILEHWSGDTEHYSRQIYMRPLQLRFEGELGIVSA